MHISKCAECANCVATFSTLTFQRRQLSTGHKHFARAADRVGVSFCSRHSKKSVCFRNTWLPSKRIQRQFHWNPFNNFDFCNWFYTILKAFEENYTVVFGNNKKKHHVWSTRFAKIVHYECKRIRHRRTNPYIVWTIWHSASFQSTTAQQKTGFSALQIRKVSTFFKVFFF